MADMVSDQIKEYLEGVVGVVEANSFEYHSLWERFATDASRHGRNGSRTFEYHSLWERFATDASRHGRNGSRTFEWNGNSSGYGCTVGHLDGRPVAISLLTSTVDGNKLLFWYATSVVVDYDMIDKWLNENLPESAFQVNMPRLLNKTDATNFINIIPSRVEAA